MISTWDVFDTCLTRDLAAPTDVFYGVGKKVLEWLKIEITPAALEDFVAVRVRAYESVRTTGGAEDVTLPVIWQEVCRKTGWTYSEALVELEMEAEASHLFPVGGTQKMIQEQRACGRRIVFVSDTYLPSAFVARLLVEHGFMQSGDKIFTSGETGKMKYTGNLFRHVLAVEKVSASEVNHFGDHERTDFKMPRQIGIQATLVNFTKVGASEQFVLREKGLDIQEASRIAGAIRKFRATESAADNALTELVAGFVGPVVMGFAVWALTQARRDGIQRLHFLARDCQLVFRAAQMLSPVVGVGMECRYLYHSRQALFLPLVSEVNERQLAWLRRDFEAPILERLLAKLELDYNDVATEFDPLTGAQQGKFVLASEEHWKFFWSALKSRKLRERILELSARRRAAANAYFEAEGLLEKESWGIVDLGWRLSCQRALQEILQLQGRASGMHGYYLGLMAARENLRAGAARALFYESAGDRPGVPVGQPLFSHIVPLEFILGSADHPTVHHYELADRVAKPVFRGRQLEETEIEFARGLQKATLQFIETNLHLANLFQNEATVRLTLSALMNRFAMHPDAALVAPLQDINAAGDQNLFGARPLIAPLNWGEVARLAMPGRFKKPGSNLLWAEGSLAVSTPARRRTAQCSQWLKDFLRRAFA